MAIENLPAGEHEFDLNSNHKAPGLYIIKGIIDGNIFDEKFVIR